MSTVEYMIHNTNKGKKSKRGFKKKTINLYEKAVTLKEYKELYDKNIYPLVIVLNKENWEEINSNLPQSNIDKQTKAIFTDYYETAVLTSENNESFMFLDIPKLQQNFYKDKIFLDKFITRTRKTKYIKRMYHSGLNDTPTRLGLVQARSFFSFEYPEKVIILSELMKKAGEDYLEKHKKRRVLTQAEIDEIHAQGKLTPEEMVKEWESFGLCAPGDAIGSAKERCREFEHSCSDCLEDYAYSSLEHTSIKNELKLTNSCIDTDQDNKTHSTGVPYIKKR